MKSIFEARPPENRAQILLSFISDTQNEIIEWVNENLGEDAAYEETDNIGGRIEHYESIFLPLDKDALEELRIDDFLSGIVVDVDFWGGSSEEGAGNFLAASTAWENFGYFIATSFCEIENKYIANNFTVDPEMLTQDNLSTFAFRCLFTATLATEAAYYDLALPEGIDFNKVINGWGSYTAHEDVLAKFEKEVVNPRIEQALSEWE